MRVMSVIDRSNRHCNNTCIEALVLVCMQGFSAADLPHVELTSKKVGRSSLFRASAARFFELRSQVSRQRPVQLAYPKSLLWTSGISSSGG